MNLLLPVAAIGILALLFGKKANANVLPVPTNPVLPKPTLPKSTLLREGSTGAAVVELQARLNEYGVTDPPLETDGIFDAEVKEAALRFQQSRGLTVDGIVGPQTWGALAAG